MHIDSLQVNGYGIFAGASIESLHPGLTLICGDNGAGKSTLLSFFRAVLFGHETGRSARTYLPLHGGRHGGSLTVTLKNGERFLIDRGPAPPAAGRLSVTPVDPAERTRSLQELTDSAARDLYRNVFAFSLDELQELQRDDAVGSRIYSAGTGARSAPSARQQLETEKAALFLSAGVKPAANQAVQKLGVLNREASNLADGVETYRNLQEDVRTLAAQIQQDQDAEPSRRARLAHVQALDQAWEHWAPLPGLRRDLKALPAPLTFPSDGLVRLETLDQRRREYETRCEEITCRIADAEAERDSLHPDERLLENAGVAADLYRGIDQWRTLSQDIEALRAEARGQRKDLDDALRRPGPGWTEQRLDEFDDSLPARAFVDELLAKMDGCSQDLRLAEDRCEQLADASRRWARDERAAADELRNRWPDEPPALTVLDARAAVLRNLTRLIADVSQAESHQMLLEQQHATAVVEHSRRQAELDAVRKAAGVSPLWIIPALALAAAGFLHAVIMAAATFALLGVVSAVLIGFAMRGGSPAERLTRAGRQADLDTAAAAMADLEKTLQAQKQTVESLRNAIRQLAREIGLRDSNPEATTEPTSEAPWNVTPDVIEQEEAALATARRDWQEYTAAATRLKDLAAASALAAAEAAKAADQAEQKRSASEATRQTWLSWLAAHRLPADLLPRTVQPLFAAVDAARNLRRQYTEITARLASMEESIRDYQELTNALLRSCGREACADGRPDEAVRILQEAIGAAREQQRRREELTAALRSLRFDYERDDQQRTQWQKRYASLLSEGGAENEPTFRENAALWERRTGLEARIRELEGRLEVLSGPGEARLSLEEELAALDRERLSAWLQDEKDALEAFSRSLGDRRQKLGEINSQVDALSTDDRVASVLQEISCETARLQEAAEEWAIRAAALWLLDRTSQQYERERQPAVFKQAGRRLDAVTGGAYTQIIKPMDEDTIAVADGAGSRRNASAWNRGLREQVYLCLRLGLIEEYSHHAEPLPIVMDDVLVNCDPAHTRRMAEVIQEFAREFQVIYLTCHTETIDLFRLVDAATPCWRIAEGQIIPWSPAASRLPIPSESDPGLVRMR